MDFPIRVLLVASPLSIQIVQQMLHGTPDLTICGTARHGREALTLLPTLRPHVVCLSDQMPVMSSLELTREIMSHHACPILVLKTPGALEIGISSGLATNQTRRDEDIFALLQAGAVDAFLLSNLVPAADAPQTRQLIAKIKMVARVPVISRPPRAGAGAELGSASAAKSETKLNAKIDGRLEGKSVVIAPRAAPRTIDISVAASTSTSASVAASMAAGKPMTTSRIVVIGASTGGPQALLAVLSEIPANYPFPILCVQHISKGFMGGLIDWLDEQCRVKIKIARSGELALPGMVYFPEEDRHLELDESGHLKSSLSPAVDGHRASATVLFQSVARNCGSRGVAVLLTGMGCDGASGLRAVHDAHGLTFAQNQESCVVFGMPAAAIALGAAQHVLTPSAIAGKLVGLAHKGAS